MEKLLICQVQVKLILVFIREREVNYLNSIVFTMYLLKPSQAQNLQTKLY